MLRTCLLAVAALVMSSRPSMADELCIYTARISAKDKINHAGQKLMRSASREGALKSIRMDRANFHRFQKRDAEDTSDCLFSQRAAREKMDRLTSGSVLSAELINRIWRDEVVLTIKVFPQRLEISEAVNAAEGKTAEVQRPSSMADATNRHGSQALNTTATEGASPPGAPRKFSLVEHAETTKAYSTIQKDQPLQEAFQQSFVMTGYAACQAMVDDLERGLLTGRYELTAQELTTYSGVAAGMVYMRQHLMRNGTAETELDQAVVNARQKSKEGAVYEQCYQAMLPVYGATRLRR
jgi:hypothetical protein